jgi:hypothetical protein
LKYPWRLFGLLVGAGAVGLAGIIPLLLEMMRPWLDRLPAPPLPLPVIVLLNVAQNCVLLALATGFGLVLARKAGRGAPLLEGWLAGDAVGARLKSILKLSIPSGAFVGAVCLGALLLASRRLPDLLPTMEGRVPVWKRLAACFYGGIFEEILMRLLLLSLAAWLLGKVWRGADGLPAAPAFWTANALVAVLFGLGHLPAASMMMTITPAVVAIAVVVNGFASIVFGQLYWTRGLEAAMLAHFTADIVLHVAGPAFVR